MSTKTKKYQLLNSKYELVSNKLDSNGNRVLKVSIAGSRSRSFQTMYYHGINTMLKDKIVPKDFEALTENQQKYLIKELDKVFTNKSIGNLGKTGNKGLTKLKQINAKAKELRTKAGFKIVKVPARKVFVLPRAKAISIASGRLYNKNRSGAMDGVADLSKINALATKLQKEKGQKTIASTQKKVYAMDQKDAVKKATVLLFGSSKKAQPKPKVNLKTKQISLFGVKKESVKKKSKLTLIKEHQYEKPKIVGRAYLSYNAFQKRWVVKDNYSSEYFRDYKDAVHYARNPEAPVNGLSRN